MQEPSPRKIIHIDMDAFYASVEQRDDPTLRGRPVAVGGSRERGVVAAASYEARAFGVRSAMSSMAAARRCPELVFVKPRFDVYRQVSQQIRAIFANFTPLIEPLSLDEAYLDVTGHSGLPTATAIAEEIRRRIRAETGLTASAGVSYNKFLAKLASDQNKPDGLCVVTPRQGPAFVAALPVKRFHGVGPKTAERMAQLGILTGADLRAIPLDRLQHHFGKAGDYYYWAARGRDDRPVRPDRERKSVGSERTFARDLTQPNELETALEPAAEAIWTHMARHGTRGRTLVLKLKYADFRTVTRSRSQSRCFEDRAAIVAVGRELLAGLLPVEQGVRLVGLTLSGLAGTDCKSPQADGVQLGLAI